MPAIVRHQHRGAGLPTALDADIGPRAAFRLCWTGKLQAPAQLIDCVSTGVQAAIVHSVFFSFDTVTVILLPDVHAVASLGSDHSSADLSSQVVAIAGAVALVLAALIAGSSAIWTSRYTIRKTFEHQRVQEFNERFSTAADKLGHQRAATRLAGLYALAGLADDWAAHRQTCIDVLCSYLRIPYEPDPTSRNYRRGEREVRRTIIRVIRDHLRPGFSAVSWTQDNFSFEGAIFDCGDLTGAQFTGGHVSFHGAYFVSGVFNFNNVRFDGARVWFTGARFDGAYVHFDGAQFLSGEVTFEGAELGAGKVSFDNVRIADSVVKWGSISPPT